MIPPTTTGASTPRSRSACHDARDQLQVRAAQDREPDDVDALLLGRGGDLRRRQADALVDDVQPDVARAHGDLLGAVGVAVEAGLADQDLRPAADRLGDALDLLAQRGQVGLVAVARGGLADAGRRAELAEGLAQRGRPLAGRHAGLGGRDRRGHDVLVGLRDAAQLGQRGLGRGARRATARQAIDRVALLGLDGGVDGHDPALLVDQRRGVGLGVLVHADDDLLAVLDAADALAVAVDQRALHVVHRLDRAAVLGDDRHLGARALQQLADEAVHDDRALEDVGVLQHVGLEGHHLLDAQRPLLVPRARQAERLVPGGQLDGAGARVAAHRHGQGLQHDALDVVLRLGLGQPQRVDLDAVAEAQLLVVGDAVALAAELLPQHRHRPQLRVLLDEAHARVDEERDAAEDLAHQLGRHALAHRVEHGDGVGHRVGDLLHRRRAGLLQVVGADVDGVPLRNLGDRVGHHVGDQPHRGAGRERVGPARQELLDDVVLRGALKRGGGDAVLLRGADVQRQQPGRRRVDRHRRVHLAERDAVQQLVHVALVGDRHADLADLAARELVVGVVAGLGRQVERDRQARLALGQVGPVQLVGLLRGRVARVGPHHPRTVALGKPVFHERNRTGRTAPGLAQTGYGLDAWVGSDRVPAPLSERARTSPRGPA